MKRRVLTLSALAVVLVLAMAASLLAGRVWLAPGQVLADLRTPGEQISELILIDLRLPRAILAVAIGATLGLAGAVLQGLLRNPLAEPGLMGVSPEPQCHG